MAPSSHPPRMCPCWSGKTLIECHDAENKPYPPDFLCCCGTWRIFCKCCGTCKIEVSERWNDGEQWILTSYQRPVVFPVTDSEVEHIDKNINVLMDLTDILPPPTYFSIALYMKDLAESLLSKGLIDLAFAYAMKQIGFVPRYVHEHGLLHDSPDLFDLF